MTTRRQLLRGGAAAAAAVWLAPSLAAVDAAGVQVWKSPTCGCCGDWIKHLEASGFRVTVHDTGNAAARTRLKVPMKYGSCHTASVGGYALEGHVPAREVKRLLAERPRAVGLTVPGMPLGSPGMEQPGGERDAFEVLLLKPNGSTAVYAAYGK